MDNGRRFDNAGGTDLNFDRPLSISGSVRTFPANRGPGSSCEYHNRKQRQESDVFYVTWIYTDPNTDIRSLNSILII